MLIHSYDEETKEYTGSEEAHVSPLEPGKFLVPPFSTTEVPPTVPDGQVAVFWESGWALVPDNRGVVYWLTDGSRHVVGELGQVIPDGALLSRPIQPADVTLERSRRLSFGFDYDFGDARGVHHIGTTADDMDGWSDVTIYANALLAIGDLSTKITIATDTGDAQVTALEWQKILIAAGVARQPIWQASFQLQAMQPIPADFADDKYWS